MLFEALAFAFDVELRAYYGKGTRGECLIVGGEFMTHDLEARHWLLRGPL